MGFRVGKKWRRTIERERLRDEAAAGQVDATGDIPEDKPRQLQGRGTVDRAGLHRRHHSGLHHVWLRQSRDPRSFDLVRRFEQVSEQEAAKIRGQIAETERGVWFLRDFARRFKSTRNPERPIESRIESKIEAGKRQIEILERAIAARAKAVELLKSYSFERDDPTSGIVFGYISVG